jgi:hypothetical protein
MKNINIFKKSPRTVGDLVSYEKTFALGDGLWSREFYDSDHNFLFEVVGENGTRCSHEEHRQSTIAMEEEVDEKCSQLLHLNTRINLRF